jgi:hypothetical protein
MFGQGFNYGFLGKPPCFTDTTDIFKDNSGVALYTLDYDASDSGGASGKFGEAAIFNGSSSKIELPSALSDGSTTDTGCISFWFNVGAEVTSSTTSNEIMQFAGTSSLTGKIALGSTSGHMSGETFSVTHNVSGVYTYSTTNIPAGWNHAVVQWNSGTGKWDIYINGTAHTTYTVGTNAQGKFKLKFGNRSSFYYKGRLDQIRIFNKSLSSSEVTTLYNETKNTTNTLQILGDTSCIATYSFDGSSTDLSGNYNGTDTNILYKYDGTPTNVDFGVGGKSLYGARFNGSSSYIDIPTLPNITGAGSSVTFSAWINFDGSSGDRFILGFREGTYVQLGFNSGYSPRKLEYKINDGANKTILVDETAITYGQWHHVCLTAQSGGVLTAYLDGVVQGTPVAIGNIANGGQQNAIGAFNSGTPAGYFSGDIDQVRIFNKALSAAEISKLYGNGAGEIACTYTSTTDNIAYPIANTAYYKLDNSAEDETGSYDGTESNITYTFGRFGQAADFSSSVSLINTGYTRSGNEFAVSMWVKASDTSTRQYLIADFDSGGADISFSFYCFIDTNDNLKIALGDGSTSQASITTGFSSYYNKWTHIVLSIASDGKTPTLYLDNNKTIGTTVTNSYQTGQNPIGLGHWGGSSTSANEFVGLMDQVRIFSSALTDSQVTELYNEKPEADTSNFKTVLYTGNSSNHYISNVGMDLETSGGLVWLKQRNSAQNHGLFDSVRGANNFIMSNSTSAENTRTTDTLSSFDANGFTLTPYSSDAFINYTGRTMVAWVWKGGGDAVSNTDGSITSQVSANTEAGFSIVKFTTSGGSGTVGHGLSSTPEVVLMKRTSSTSDWYLFTTVIDGSMDLLKLNSTVSKTNDLTQAFTSTTFKDWASTGDWITYCFHSVSGISSIGSYIGAGSGTRVYTTSDGTSTGTGGFKPSWVMLKNASVGGTFYDWYIYDVRRNDNDGDDNIESYLRANLSDAEVTSNTGSNGIVMEDDGFTLDISATSINGTGNTFIYMAFK